LFFEENEIFDWINLKSAVSMAVGTTP